MFKFDANLNNQCVSLGLLFYFLTKLMIVSAPEIKIYYVEPFNVRML